MQHRWSRGRSKERGYSYRAHHIDGEMGMNESEGTDYAADNSSDHSSSATHSPRHKPTQYGDSPLARKHLLNNDNRDLLSSQPDLSTTDNVRTSLTVAQVHYLPLHLPSPPAPNPKCNLCMEFSFDD